MTDATANETENAGEGGAVVLADECWLWLDGPNIARPAGHLRVFHRAPVPPPADLLGKVFRRKRLSCRMCVPERVPVLRVRSIRFPPLVRFPLPPDRYELDFSFPESEPEFAMAQSFICGVAKHLAECDQEAKEEAGERISGPEARRRLRCCEANLNKTIERNRKILGKWDVPTPQTAFLAVALPGMGVELRELYLPVDPARFGGGNRSSVAAAQLSEAFWPLSYRLNSLAGLLLIASIWRAAFEKEGMDALLLMAFEKCVYSAIHNSGVRAGRLLERAESARAVKAQKRGNKKLPLPFTPLEVLERYEALPRREGFSDMDRYADVGESLMRDYPNVPQLPWKRVKALCTQARKDRKKLQQSS